jgi:hypothetical protein
MKTKFLVLVLFMVISVSGYGQTKKNEIEINSISFGLSDENNSVGLCGKYRYFLNDRFALYGRWGGSYSSRLNPLLDSQIKVYGFQIGMGGNYFFKNKEKGFYLNGGLTYFNYSSQNSTYTNLKSELGLGYKLPISSKFFLNGELNHEYNFRNNNSSMNGKFGIGIRF